MERSRKPGPRRQLTLGIAAFLLYAAAPAARAAGEAVWSHDTGG